MPVTVSYKIKLCKVQEQDIAGGEVPFLYNPSTVGNTTKQTKHTWYVLYNAVSVNFPVFRGAITYRIYL